jgi:hypothetical protein
MSGELEPRVSKLEEQMVQTREEMIREVAGVRGEIITLRADFKAQMAEFKAEVYRSLSDISDKMNAQTWKYLWVSAFINGLMVTGVYYIARHVASQ